MINNRANLNCKTLSTTYSDTHMINVVGIVLSPEILRVHPLVSNDHGLVTQKYNLVVNLSLFWTFKQNSITRNRDYSIVYIINISWKKRQTILERHKGQRWFAVPRQNGDKVVNVTARGRNRRDPERNRMYVFCYLVLAQVYDCSYSHTTNVSFCSTSYRNFICPDHFQTIGKI